MPDVTTPSHGWTRLMPAKREFHTQSALLIFGETFREGICSIG